MPKKEIISFCGDTCSECPRYQASMEDDKIRLQNLAELWYRLGLRNQVVTPEEMICKGCSRDKDCAHGINTCPDISNLNNCGECKQYPCNKIKKVFERTTKIDSACKEKCSSKEYGTLKRAFLSKKETLDAINKQYFRNN